MQEIPRLPHVTPGNINFVGEQELLEAEKMWVTADNVSASIPNLDKLEEMILAVKSAA